MKIKLIKEKIESKDINMYNCDTWGEYELGNEFIVYGIIFEHSDSGFNQIIYYKVYIRDSEYLISYPCQLFEIVDPTIPDDWLLKEDENKDFQLSSALLHKRYFFDLLSDGEPDCKKKFEKLKRRYEDAEFTRLVYKIFNTWRSFQCVLNIELLCLKYLPKFTEYIEDEEMLYIAVEDVLLESIVSDYSPYNSENRSEIEGICNKVKEAFNKAYNI